MTDKPKVTMLTAIRLQCHECLGHYRDGKTDCENPRCTLYTWMPYRRLQPSLERFRYAPLNKGLVLVADKLAARTDAQRESAKKLAELSKKGTK